MNLIYISNTRIPSEKANTYQSMVMCEAFSRYFDKVEFWYPKRDNTKRMNQIKDVYKFYNIKEVFLLKEVYSFDNKLLQRICDKVWFIVQNISFAINYIQKLRKLEGDFIVFTRDNLGLNILGFAKRYGLVKQKVFFEAHIYSEGISKNIGYIDGLVVINNYLKKLYEQDGIKNILVSHDGVKLKDYEKFKYKQEKKNNIVYIGNLFKWKGVYTLIDSMKYLNDVVLTIVGGSDDTLPKFKEYVKKSKITNINIIGFVKKEDTLKYIQKADVLVLPNSARDKMSYYTSPLKLFEYMASKRPIVASRLPSIGEVLKDGKNAILCEPDNPKDLADKIQWALKNDCSTIAKQAYKDVQEYTWDIRAKNITRWINDD